MTAERDEFGAYLERLRRARELSAQALSKKLKLSGNYIHKWESLLGRVNREMLLRVADALDAGQVERAELFRLADLRDAPDAAKHLYEPPPGAASDRNVLDAILDVEHDWPSDPQPLSPHPRSERTRLLIEAAAWALAEIAASQTDLFPPFSGIRWPQTLIDLGIVPPLERYVSPALKRQHNPVDIPETMLREELPFVDQLSDPVSPHAAFVHSLGMARVYRRLLFSSMDIARTLAQMIERWECDRSFNLHDCVSMIFRSRAIHEAYGFRDVQTDVVANVAKRSLSISLWCDQQTRADPIPWPYESDSDDIAALAWLGRWAAYASECSWNYPWAFGVRIAAYLIRSRAWPYAAEAICEQFRVSPKDAAELEAQLRKGDMREDTRALLGTTPWGFAGVDRDFLLSHVRSLEASMPPPDKFALWKYGEPYPKGHPIWKPGADGAPVLKDKPKTPAKPKKRTRAKRTKKR